MTCNLKVKIKVRRNYDSTENVTVDGREVKEATLIKVIDTIEECLTVIKGAENEVVRMCWNEVKDTEEFEEFDWYGPYAQAEDITLSPSSYSSTGITIHNIVDKIAELDNVEDKAGVYYHLMNYSSRIEVNERRFLEYLAEERGIDTSYYTHGVSSE